MRNMGVKVPGSRRRQDSVGRDLAQCDGFNNNPISQAGGSRLGAGGRKMLTLGAASPGLPLALDRCCLACFRACLLPRTSPGLGCSW